MAYEESTKDRSILQRLHDMHTLGPKSYAQPVDNLHSSIYASLTLSKHVYDLDTIIFWLKLTTLFPIHSQVPKEQHFSFLVLANKLMDF